MAAPLNCCNSCSTVETVNVPGVEGDPGTDGTNGINAYTNTTTNTVLPAEGAQTAPVTVDSTLWMVVGQILIMGDGVNSVGETGWGHFQVFSIPSATTVVLTYLDYPGDKGTGQTLLAGCTLSPAGLIGPAGP